MSGLYTSQASAASPGVGSSSSPGVSSGVGSALGVAGAATGNPLLAFGAPIVGSLIDGLFGSSSQKRANELNYRIQRETNALNYNMFLENWRNQWNMWNRSNEYNSPKNQRKLMEEAGFNPNMIFGNPQSAASPMGGNSPSAVVGNAMQPTYRAGLLNQGVANGVNAVSALAESRLKSSQAQGQDIENQYSAALKAADLQGKGLSNAAQAIKNDIAWDTSEEVKRSAQKQNALLDASTKKALAESAVSDALVELHKSNIHLNQQRVNEILSHIELNEELKLTEKSKRDLYALTGRAEIINAIAHQLEANTGAYLAPSQKAYNEAAAGNQASQGGLADESAYGLHIQNTIKQKYGERREYEEIMNLIEQRNLMKWQEDELWRKIQLINKDINWYEFHQVVGLMQKTTDAAEKAVYTKVLFGM